MATEKQIQEFKKFIENIVNEYTENIEEIEYDMDIKIDNFISITEQFQIYLNGYIENWTMNKECYEELFKKE